MHTIIIGNGILALSTAFRLAKRSDPSNKITIIGEKSRIGAATLAAPAMLNSFAELEVNSLDSEIDQYLFEISRSATLAWARFESEILEASEDVSQEICLSQPSGRGTYIINNSYADDLDDENFDAIVDALKRFKEPFDFISPRDIPNYMPEQKSRATRSIYIPNEGWINPKYVITSIEGFLSNSAKVTFVDCPAVRLISNGTTIQAVEVGNGNHISGDKYVLATGASVTEVLEKSQIGTNIQRIFYGVGVSIQIHSPEFPHKNCIRTPNRGLACGLYSAPYYTNENLLNEHILVGASNFISPIPYNYGRLTSVESLMRGAIEQINSNFYRADLIKVNVGWRPTSQDTYPLIGKTSIRNLIIATGTKRNGFHLSPVISEKIVGLLYDEILEDQFSWFSPERQLIKSLSREQAIEKSVRHLMSAAYQHGFTPSKSRMSQQIIQMHKENLERLHDRVGAYDWGIPPEMLDMYRYGHAIG